MPTKRANVDVSKIRGLMPAFDEFGFGPGYLPALLDRHITELTEKAQRDPVRSR
jgi:hypothetical protein